MRSFVSRFPTVQALAAAPLDAVLAGLGRARLLRPRPQPACLRAGGRGAGRLSGRPGGLAGAAGHRRLHRRGRRRDRVRHSRRAGRRQCRAGRRADVRHRGRRCRRPSRRSARRPRRLGRRSGGAGAAERLCPGAVRSGRNGLHAGGAGLCAFAPGSTAARRGGWASARRLPRKAPKKLRPVRYGVHFWLTDEQGHVLLRRRPVKGCSAA